VDPRAPKDLAPAELDALKADPEIAQLRELRDQLSFEAREEYRTLKRAEAQGTMLFQMYKTAENNFRYAKAKALKYAKKTARQQFFATISTIEINKQLDPSLLDLDKDCWEPSMVEHYLEERRLVADLICRDTYGLTNDAKVNHRTHTITALVALCQKRETPKRHKPDRT
jgi:hypothetical protein